MYNKITIIGRIASLFEISYTSNNVPYIRFTIAVNRPNYGNNNNNDITDFLPAVAWRKTAEFIANNLQKGSLVLVEGPLYSSTYNSKQTNQLVRSLDISVETIKALESKKTLLERQQNSNDNFVKADNNLNNFVQQPYKRSEEFEYSNNKASNPDLNTSFVSKQDNDVNDDIEHDISDLFNLSEDLD